MKDFHLHLDSPPGGIYFTGMTVTGTVLVKTDKPKNYKFIRVKLIGFAKVKWTEQHKTTGYHGRVETHSYCYSSSEYYINTFVTVWSERTSSGSDKLPAGTNEFPFSLQLVGDNLPSSYTDGVCKIKYFVNARIVSASFIEKDHVCKREIVVKDWIGVNRPKLFEPESTEVQHILCCWCCKSDPVIIRVNMPRVGYYTQQDSSIPVTVSVENRTDRRIEGETLSLHTEMIYKTRNKTRCNLVDLDIINSVSIPAQSTRETQHLLPIPFNAPPSILNCNIIRLGYYVEIQAATQTIKIPVVLGFPPQDAVSQPGLLPPQNEECYPPLGMITEQPVS